ncbi:MAG: hypothetical protein KTR26_18075 [Flammeovirgaceae bacterium]|nr:hypothetical protein [Flammeovirgaceae bacterium]
MKKILSIFLTCTLLISNIGLTMATHYCAGEAVESRFMLISGEIGCGMEDIINEDCDQYPLETALKKASCCDSDFQLFQMEDDLDTSKSGVNLNLTVAVIFIQSYFKKFSPTEVQTFALLDYSPPLPDRDFQALFQNFLI